MALDQSTWNLLFGWTGKQCFLPEGCGVPTIGVVVYLIVLVGLGFGGYLLYKYNQGNYDTVREVLEEWRE